MGTSASKTESPEAAQNVNEPTDINTDRDTAMLRSQLEQLKKLILTEEANLKTITEKAGMLRIEVADNTRKSKLIQDEVKTYSEYAEKLKAEIVTNKWNSKFIQNELKVYREEKEHLKDEIANDTRKSKAIQDELKTYNTEAERLKIEIKTNTRQHTRIQDELKTCTRNLECLKANIANDTLKSKAIQYELAGYKDEAERTKVEIEANKRELINIQDEIETNVILATNYMDEMEKVKKNSADFKAEIARDEKISKGLKAELQEFKALALTLANDKRKMEKEIEMLKEAHSKIQDENKIYEEQWRVKRERQLADEVELDERLISLNESLMTPPKPKNHLAEGDSDDMIIVQPHFDKFNVVSVQKFVNGAIYAEYAAKKKTFFARHGIQNVNELYLFKAVLEKDIPDVLEKGFNTLLSKSKEIIFFVHAEKADGYFKRETHNKHIILSSVLTCHKCGNINGEIMMNFKNDVLMFVKVYAKDVSLPIYLIKYSNREP